MLLSYRCCDIKMTRMYKEPFNMEYRNVECSHSGYLEHGNSVSET